MLGDDSQRERRSLELVGFDLQPLPLGVAFGVFSLEVGQVPLLLEHRIGRGRGVADASIRLGPRLDGLVQRPRVRLRREEGLGVRGETAKHLMDFAARNGGAE